MSVPFSRTLRSLERDGPMIRGPFLLMLLLSVAGWLAWLVLARVPVLASTNRSRLEVSQEAHEVSSPASGIVVATSVSLDALVLERDPLLTIDSSADKLKLGMERAREEGTLTQLARLREEISAVRASIGPKRQAAMSEVSLARARHEEALEDAKMAGAELTLLRPLVSTGDAAPAEQQRAQSMAHRKHIAALGLAHDVQRAVAASIASMQDAEQRIVQLTREEARLTAIAAESKALTEATAHAIEQKTVRAPIAGRIGRVAPLTVGSYVTEGAHIATVVPPGTLKVVAYFEAAIALGRIRPGQPARLRLDGFAWTHFGSLRARVAAVGHEAKEGVVRVELSLEAGAPETIPTEHGLPGQVDVEVDQVSPATLLLESAALVPSQAAVNQAPSVEAR